MEDALTPEIRLQGARDWAASIQSRFAERFSGTLARATNAAPTHIHEDHLGHMRRAVHGAGVNMDEFEAVLARPSSPKVGEFDEPKTRELIQHLVDEVSETMTKYEMSAGGRQLLVSSVPSGLVNAFCCSNTWDEEYHHVFVDSDLLIFCASLAKIVVTCFTRGVVRDNQILFESPRIISNVKARDVVGRVKDMFASIVFAGTVRASQPWVPDGDALSLYIALNMAMERFVVAHELSHLMLGHLDGASESVRVSNEGFADTEATIFSQQAEHEADAAGSILATETAVRLGYSSALTSIAPYVFLKGVEVLEACQARHDRQSGGIDSTHPSASNRLSFLRAVMTRHMKRKDPDGTLPIVLRRMDQVFFWIRQHALAGIAEGTASGLVPPQRQSLRVFEADQRPGILGLRVDPRRMEQISEAMLTR